MDLIEKLREREKKLKSLKVFLEKRISGYPEENLFVKKDKRKEIMHYRYYKYLEGRRIFLPNRKSEKEIKALAQKSYETKLLENCKKELEHVSSLLRVEENCCVYDTWDRIPQAIRQFAVPIKKSVSMIADEFMKTSHGTSGEKPGQYRVTTKEGILVKSKAEQIIADELFSKNLLYRYERTIRCLDDTIRSPDFTILDSGSGKLYFWEHMGMMERPDYIRTQCEKMNSYSVTGIIPGDNLIITIADDRRLDVREFTDQVREIIKRIFNK